MQVQSHRCDLLQAAGDLVVQVPGVLHQDRIWFPIAQSSHHALGQAGAPTVRLKGLFRACGKGGLLNPIECCLPIRLPRTIRRPANEQTHLVPKGRKPSGLHAGHPFGATFCIRCG
jgi:hypothetical protein